MMVIYFFIPNCFTCFARAYELHISERNIIKTKFPTQSKAKSFFQQKCEGRRKLKEHHIHIHTKKETQRTFCKIDQIIRKTKVLRITLGKKKKFAHYRLRPLPPPKNCRKNHHIYCHPVQLSRKNASKKRSHPSLLSKY